MVRRGIRVSIELRQQSLDFCASHKRSKRRLGYFGFCDPNPLQYSRRCGCLTERGPLSWPEEMDGFRTHRSRGLDDWADFGLIDEET